MIKTVIKMKKVIYLIIIVLTAGFFASCKDMDSTYKEFLVPDGLTYPQKPDSLKVYSGFNTLRLTWLKAKDPSVVRAEIYWNNYFDTLKIDNIPDNDTIVVDIPVNDENTYTFNVKTFDADGNVSIPAEASGAAYGDNYILGTNDRTFASALRDADYNGTITWNGRTTDLVYSEVRYTTSSGEKRIVRVAPEETILVCPDIKPGELFEYRSVFLPPKGVSVVEKEWVTYEYSFLYKYPRNTWTAEAKGGHHSWWDAGAGGGMPALMFDGTTTTGWHSNTGSAMPQCMIIDMKQSLPVYQIIMYPPANVDWCYWDDIDIYFSDTPIAPTVPQPSWGEPVARLKYPGPKGSTWTIEFPTVLSTQYVAIAFLHTTKDVYINIMEFEVIGY
jgi:hypothetical protein